MQLAKAIAAAATGPRAARVACLGSLRYNWAQGGPGAGDRDRQTDRTKHVIRETTQTGCPWSRPLVSLCSISIYLYGFRARLPFPQFSGFPRRGLPSLTSRVPSLRSQPSFPVFSAFAGFAGFAVFWSTNLSRALFSTHPEGDDGDPEAASCRGLRHDTYGRGLSLVAVAPG